MATLAPKVSKNSKTFNCHVVTGDHESAPIIYG